MANGVVIPFKLGFKVETARTISEADVYSFAGISGDLNRVHMNQQYMETTDIGQRVAHGMCTFSVASAAETKLLDAGFESMEASGTTYLSAGYEHVRFIKPVLFGDTITTTYEITEVDEENNKTFGQLTCVNQRGETVLVGVHILKYFPKRS